jgi:hypothetical protein
MERGLSLSRVVGALTLVIASCSGGQTGDSPSNPAREPAQHACHERRDCEPPAPTPENLDGFARASGSGAEARDYDPPRSIEDAVQGAPLVIVGTLVAVTDGRKEYIGLECRLADPEDETNRTCQGPPDVIAYSSHVNLVIDPELVIAGNLEKPDADLHVEFHWPNNLSIDPLRASAPLGARVLVLGWPVPDARAQAKPLEDAGLVPRDSVADNLYRFPPYGLAFADVDGFVADAFGGRELRLLIDPEAPVPFDALIGEIQRSVAD